MTGTVAVEPDIDRWEEFGRAHAERFAEHPPVTTMVEVSRLIRADVLIEIEVDALIDDPRHEIPCAMRIKTSDVGRTA